MFLKADTETIVTLGPFVDKTDGVTPVSGVTLGAADEAELLKHGSTAVVDISGNTWAAVTSMAGYYSLTITAAQTDTEGQLMVAVGDASECLPVMAKFTVVNANVYDSLFAAATTDYLDVNILQIAANANAATRLSTSAQQILIGTVNDASATTTVFIVDDINGSAPDSTDDHYNDRALIWTSGNLAGQVTDVADYTGGTGTFTVTAMTEAPADNDTFILI